MTKKFSQADLDRLPKIVRRILIGRRIITDQEQLEFLNPDYEVTNYDPFLLPGMKAAVKRLQQAADNNELVTVYSDYDVDGTTSAAVLIDALPKFGLKIDWRVPDRFKDGYGLNKKVIQEMADQGTKVLLTVDNGIVSFDEVKLANKLDMDVIVTDHHTPREELPEALAVIDPKILARDYPDEYDEHFVAKNKKECIKNGRYPFLDLCGCGVAFTLVRALQKVMPDKLPAGQEKWLLDLVAMATVSDIVGLVDENRAIVKWGLIVLKNTRRPGIKALTAVANIKLDGLTSRDIGFVLGPRINAAGRLKNAALAIKLLSSTDNEEALELAVELNNLNTRRKSLQNKIYEEAIKTIDPAEPLAIAVGKDWHEGVIGIVASKVEETTEKPTFVFSCKDTPGGEVYKASARSFGEFSIAAAINATSSLLIKGGGHAAAGGVSVAGKDFATWRQAVNDYYRSLKLKDQKRFLYPEPDIAVNDLSDINVELVKSLDVLEPYGEANPVPVIKLHDVIINARRLMGNDLQHVRYILSDDAGRKLTTVAFNAADKFTMEPGEFGSVNRCDALIELMLNEWRGTVSVEARLIKMDPVEGSLPK